MFLSNIPRFFSVLLSVLTADDIDKPQPDFYSLLCQNAS